MSGERPSAFELIRELHEASCSTLGDVHPIEKSIDTLRFGDVRPQLKTLLKTRQIAPCLEPDWRVDRTAVDLEKKMGVVRPKKLVGTHAAWLRARGEDVSSEHPLVFVDMGSGDGSTVQELSEHGHRDYDVDANRDDISDYVLPIGVTQQFLFSLRRLMFNHLKDEADTAEMREFISVLSILLLQIIKERPFDEGALTNELLDNVRLAMYKLFSVLEYIAPTLPLFDNEGDPYCVQLSEVQIRDMTYEIVNPGTRKLVKEWRDGARSFLRDYFQEKCFRLDIASHERELPIFASNTLLCPFQELPERFPAHIAPDVIYSCRGSAHLKTKEEYADYLSFSLEALPSGGRIHDDGFRANWTGESRLDVVANICAKAGSGYHPLLLVHPGDQVDEKRSIIIQRAYNGAFYPESKLREIVMPEHIWQPLAV